MNYLVAALWAKHWRVGRTGEAIPLARACALLRNSATGSENTERRFINLLDADGDQLPHRLRQIVALVKDYNLDFELLLRDLLYWNDDQKRTQNQWARNFYRYTNEQAQVELNTQEEVTP